jgi:hypothetical protein
MGRREEVLVRCETEAVQEERRIPPSPTCTQAVAQEGQNTRSFPTAGLGADRVEQHNPPSQTSDLEADLEVARTPGCNLAVHRS